MANDDSTRKPIDPAVTALITRLREHRDRVRSIAWTNLRNDLDQAANTIETLAEDISERDKPSD
jgi:hypothetical protein